MAYFTPVLIGALHSRLAPSAHRRSIVPSPPHRRARQGLAGLFFLAALTLVPGRVSHALEEPKPFEFKQGDRIVLVGDTFIERDQRYGYLETLLTLAHPELNLTFRNLGWSGDTVAGLSRAGFDPPEAGFRELKEHILAAKPTVAIVGYGMADSFDGPAGLPRFVKGLNTLLDVIASTGARVILVSPIAHEDLGRPLPDPAAHNRDLALYTEAIRKVAGQRQATVRRALRLVQRAVLARAGSESGRHYTDNGIHLTESGYMEAAQAIFFRLGQELAEAGEGRRDPRRRHGAPVARRQGDRRAKRPTAGSSFDRADDSPEVAVAGQLRAASEPRLQVPGLKPGRYVLKVDGKEAARADAAGWGRGVSLEARPVIDQVEQLRKAINAKNLLFFYRWRPQNVTYLFGFRKHEQGNNAIEVPQFDPLVEEKEREIARLCKPLTHHYELIRESEVAK